MIKKEKQHAIVTLLITGLTFGILCLAAWFHTPNQISVSERRRLAQLPALTKDSVGKGNFMSGFERYSQDQFPFREAFRKLKTKALFSLYQQKDVHGIYVADGYAASIESEINEASVSHAVNAFEHVYTQYLKNGSHEIYAAIVPDKGYYLAAKNGYPVMDYDKFFKYFENGMPYAKFIDLTQTLSLESFYFTDSHWRQESLIETANQIKRNMKNDILSDDYDICQAADSFYGVYSGQAALQVTPDKIMYIGSEIISQAQVYNYETKKTGGVYDWDKLTGYDPYDFFLSGPSALLRIENPKAAEKKNLIVFRDSYGSSLIPLLIDSYSSIVVVDLRYIAQKKLGELIDFESDEISNADVLFLYGTILLNDSSTIKK